MSGGDFQVGDVVCCIDDSEDDRHTLQPPFPEFIKRGRLYRAVALTMTSPGVQGVRLQGDPNNVPFPHGSWARDRFRKLPKADEQFTQSIRACKPHHNRVPA